jgi:hypothetical protein
MKHLFCMVAFIVTTSSFFSPLHAVVVTRATDATVQTKASSFQRFYDIFQGFLLDSEASLATIFGTILLLNRQRKRSRKSKKDFDGTAFLRVLLILALLSVGFGYLFGLAFPAYKAYRLAVGFIFVCLLAIIFNKFLK